MVAHPTPARDRAILLLLAIWSAAVPAAGAAVAWATSDHWVAALRAAGDAAPWWCLLLTIALTGLSLLPSHVSALACGYALGAATGTLVAWTGIGLAAVLGYALALPLVVARTERVLAHQPRAAAVHRALLDRSRGPRIALVALLRLSPAMPFALTNFLMAAAKVPFVDFQCGSWLGMTPRIVAVTLAGAGLSELVEQKPQSPWLLVIGIAATLAAVTWIARIARQALRARGVG